MDSSNRDFFSICRIAELWRREQGCQIFRYAGKIPIFEHFSDGFPIFRFFSITFPFFDLLSNFLDFFLDIELVAAELNIRMNSDYPCVHVYKYFFFIST